ncbi:MAG: glycosyltransferase [Syntrophorhabdaceae bacterium]|nr:glycosyltransferase [Syntrophorhabdaceae bacterium]
MKPITVLMSQAYDKSTCPMLKKSALVEDTIITSSPITASDTLKPIVESIKTEYFLILNADQIVEIDDTGLTRMLKEAHSKKAGIVYSDFYEIKDDKKILHPLIDYQLGSVRDDFDFGNMILFSNKAVKDVLNKYGKIPEVSHAGLYDLRLKVSIDNPVCHIHKPLYTVIKKDAPCENGGLFAYVNPENLNIQKEMELVFTGYLKNIEAYIPSDRLRYVEKTDKTFPVEASVIIPVKNRASTIADAVKSALDQKADFEYNIIVVDNHSEDGTPEILSEFTKRHKKLIHIIPERNDLEIGGCWNEAIYSYHCGRYAIQLDSDDLYSSPHTLQRIVDMFREKNYAMVIGSYKLVDFNLKEIPPGLIDHKEWSDENGHNNALRVNGLGAPRAFDTEIVRRIGFLNISYGEDYHMALSICGEYRIGRIFECLYLCRRWEDNTDANLSIERKNMNNALKDRIRTEEILKRKEKIKQVKAQHI